jgi:hypothetical protein
VSQSVAAISNTALHPKDERDRPSAVWARNDKRRFWRLSLTAVVSAGIGAAATLFTGVDLSVGFGIAAAVPWVIGVLAGLIDLNARTRSEVVVRVAVTNTVTTGLVLLPAMLAAGSFDMMYAMIWIASVILTTGISLPPAYVGRRLLRAWLRKKDAIYIGDGHRS